MNRSVVLWVVLSLAGWVPFIVFPPMIHGGTLFEIVLTQAGIVIGGYATIELIRRAKSWWAKALWSIWLAPYALLLAAFLLSGIGSRF